MLHNAQLTNFLNEKKKNKKSWGLWITETEQIQEMTQNPRNEVNDLTCSSHTVKIHLFFKKGKLVERLASTA